MEILSRRVVAAETGHLDFDRPLHRVPNPDVAFLPWRVWVGKELAVGNFGWQVGELGQDERHRGVLGVWPDSRLIGAAGTGGVLRRPAIRRTKADRHRIHDCLQSERHGHDPTPPDLRAVSRVGDLVAGAIGPSHRDGLAVCEVEQVGARRLRDEDDPVWFGLDQAAVVGELADRHPDGWAGDGSFGGRWRGA
jgi:hypothetical protein